MRLGALVFRVLILVSCATANGHVESTHLLDRWPTLRTVGLVAPTVDVDESTADADGWKRDAEEVVTATFGSELRKRGAEVIRLLPKPSTKDALAALVRRFDDSAELAARAAKRGEGLALPGALGDLAALSKACGVDGFLLASATAVPPAGAPRPSAVAQNQTSFQAIREAASGEGLSGQGLVRLGWLAAGVVDRNGEVLWFATTGTPGGEEGDLATDVAAELAEKLPGKGR